ncbi:MAG: hypothetical protein CMP55_05735 [Flavobacteriales bacterium]|nr:hypothetical protein [Flavobacteriales bacterium]|tara:strand:+ start:3320 stop:3592 length:273 start_codon:yes stop_codon:yes gene_type:complete
MDKNDNLFSELLYILHRNASNLLDKLDDDNCSDSDISAAQQLLDMVLMLKDKTSGNLSEELDKIQNMMLAELESKFAKKIKRPKNNGSAK